VAAARTALASPPPSAGLVAAKAPAAQSAAAVHPLLHVAHLKVNKVGTRGVLHGFAQLQASQAAGAESLPRFVAGGVWLAWTLRGHNPPIFCSAVQNWSLCVLSWKLLGLRNGSACAACAISPAVVVVVVGKLRDLHQCARAICTLWDCFCGTKPSS
jgi:hypothetical protein